MDFPEARIDKVESSEGSSMRSAIEVSRRPWLQTGMALRVVIGFAAVAVTVIVANLSTQQSAREAREKVRELIVQHEPLVRATETLAATVSTYERVITDQSESSTLSQQPVKTAGCAGIGLSNTRARLEQLYGTNHAFSLDNLPEGGVRVRMVFPFRPVEKAGTSHG